ncbi:metal-dependent hydrolase [candidate division WWE3 bacterium]|nr:metal-dependent hydrolase [candidate division WWE3 bacterium]
MIFTHAFAGAILGKYLKEKMQIEDVVGEKETTTTSKSLTRNVSLIYFFSILGSIFPDFDLLLLVFNQTLHHRYLVTHSLVLYSMFFCVALLFRKKFNIRFIPYFYLGVCLHLLLDFFAGGIVLFAPVSYKLFGMQFRYFGSAKINFVDMYFKSNYMLFELGLFFSYILFVFQKETNFIARKLPFILLIVSIVTLGIFVVL